MWAHTSYIDVVDTHGNVVKTAVEVQTEVRTMLQRLGAAKAFADQIAVDYAAPGRPGMTLHAMLEAEIASLPPNSAVVSGPRPTRAEMDVAAAVVDAESYLFSMRDTTKPGIDVMGEVTAGELEFMVRAELASGERGTLSGGYMFDRMLDHFRSSGTAITVIQGNWTYESNLSLFNRLSRVGLTPEEAAAGTITGGWAGRNGYTTVTDVVVWPAGASPGAYTKVTAKFRR